MTKNQNENSNSTVQNYINNNTNYFFEPIIPLIDLVETYQGEGPNCGKKMVLARFKYCNKACPFCDTQKMMNDMNTTLYSLYDISMLLKRSHNLMITGGEPTIQSKNSNYIMSQFDFTKLMLYSLNYDFVDIETNGFKLVPLLQDLITHADYPENSSINISWSPKFISDNDYRYNLEMLYFFKKFEDEYKNSPLAIKKIYPIIKIVISDNLPQYKKFIYEVVLKYKFDPNRVYLMPEGTNIEQINKSMESVLKVASDLGCNVSSRLHIIHNFK